MGIEAVVAFVGGVLSLLSPCSALLLPAFFAYAFPSRVRLLLRTLVFYLGLITLLVPIGLGIGALGSLFLERRAELSLIAGLLLIGIGEYQLAVGGFELPGASRLQGRSFGASGESLGQRGDAIGLRRAARLCCAAWLRRSAAGARIGGRFVRWFLSWHRRRDRGGRGRWRAIDE